MFRNAEFTASIIAKQVIKNPLCTMRAAMELRAKMEHDAHPTGIEDGGVSGDEFAAWLACRALDHVIDECQTILGRAMHHYRENVLATKPA